VFSVEEIDDEGLDEDCDDEDAEEDCQFLLVQGPELVAK
jgi:hypothetical protein